MAAKINNLQLKNVCTKTAGTKILKEFSCLSTLSLATAVISSTFEMVKWLCPEIHDVQFTCAARFIDWYGARMFANLTEVDLKITHKFKQQEGQV